MPITFEQKTRIIQQIADPALWKSSLNMAWLLSDKRRERSVTLPGETRIVPNEPLQSTRMIQRMHFDLSGWQDVPVYKVVNAVKLAIARDLGIEPELKAFNELDRNKWLSAMRAAAEEADEYEYELPGNHWRNDPEKKELTDFEKDWLDTTEFSGLAVGLPRRFFIEKTDQGFDIATSLDFREWIIAHGTVLKEVTSKGARTIAAPQNTVPPKALLDTLEQGHTVRDHNGYEWNVAVLEHVKPYGVQTRYAREAMTQNFGLEGYDYAVIAIDEGLTLVGMRSLVLENAQRAYAASRRLMDAITIGLPAGMSAAEFFRQKGLEDANLRYIENTDGGRRTFLDVMIGSGRYEMASAWCEVKKIPRNYALSQPEPKAA